MAREQRAAPASEATSGLPQDLVEIARERLCAELQRLPEWGTPGLWVALRASQRDVSLGARAYYLRLAARAGDTAAVREMFVLLLERVELANRRWAAREAARTGLAAGPAAEVREELRQELTLRLWEALARGGSEAWEIFFSRSLDFAQRHTAAAYLQQRGLRAKPGVARSSRASQRLLVSLAYDGEADDAREQEPPAERADPFTAAELSDLRALVSGLPPRQRAAIIMRYWQDAPEDEVARGLGVSSRMVRYYLRQAYARLRADYGGLEATDAR